jgi:hypothetical protein
MYNRNFVSLSAEYTYTFENAGLCAGLRGVDDTYIPHTHTHTHTHTTNSHIHTFGNARLGDQLRRADEHRLRVEGVGFRVEGLGLRV